MDFKPLENNQSRRTWQRRLLLASSFRGLTRRLALPAWSSQQHHESVRPMEIIVLPYLAVSFAIAWAVFSPFSSIEEMDEWKFARLTSSDLLAVFIPIGGSLSAASWLLNTRSLPFWGYSILVSVVIGYAAASLVTGLYLIDKMLPLPSLKRVAISGIIVPLGVFLIFAWGIFPLWAYKYSMLALAGTMLALIPVTAALHFLSRWVCRTAAER